MQRIQQIRSTQSFNLFSMPGFLSGMARVLDMGHTFDNYNYSKNEREADRKALLSDWVQVGNDIIYVLERYEDVEKKNI